MHMTLMGRIKRPTQQADGLARTGKGKGMFQKGRTFKAQALYVRQRCAQVKSVRSTSNWLYPIHYVTCASRV